MSKETSLENFKTFPLNTILSATTDRLLTTSKGPNNNGIGDLYELLDHMTGVANFTHQLGRAADDCRPWLFAWYPKLKEADRHLELLDSMLESDRSSDTCSKWVNMLINDFGFKKDYGVPEIPKGNHSPKDPIKELIEMMS